MIITETIKKSAIKTAIASGAAKGFKLMGASAAVTLGVIGGIAVAGIVIEQSGKFMNRRKAKAEGKSTAQADKEYEAAAAATAAAATTAGTNTFKNAVKRASDVVKESEKVVAKSAAAADAVLDKTRDIIKDVTGNGAPTEADLKSLQEAADKAAKDLAAFTDKTLGEVAAADAATAPAAPVAPNSEVFDANAQGSVIEDVLNKSMAADKAAKDAKDAENLPTHDAAQNAVHNADLAAEAQEHAPVAEVPKPAADVSAPSAIADAVKDIGKGDADKGSAK